MKGNFKVIGPCLLDNARIMREREKVGKERGRNGERGSERGRETKTRRNRLGTTTTRTYLASTPSLPVTAYLPPIKFL